MLKKCERCRSAFQPKYSFATLCTRCFSETMEKRDCPHCWAAFWTRKSHPPEQPCKTCLPDCYQEALRKIGLLEHLNRMAQRARENSISLSADLLRDLIFLSHPDKHSNSEKATRTAQKLLALRSQQEEVA